MPTMLTLKQVSERLGLHINTIRRYVDEGLIPIVKFQRAIRVEQRDLAKFIKARKQAAKKKVIPQKKKQEKITKPERRAIRKELLRTLEDYHPDFRDAPNICNEVKKKLGLKNDRPVASEGFRCVEEGLIEERKNRSLVRRWKITALGIEELESY